MGWQHPGENGQWPHLDPLYANPNIDFVSFDNYLPLTDWTTGRRRHGRAELERAGLYRRLAAAGDDMNGLGLIGPFRRSIRRPISRRTSRVASISTGSTPTATERRVAASTPTARDLQVSLPQGDRLAQARNPYYADQEILANKQLRWWWNNTHQAVYDTGDGPGGRRTGPQTEWVPQLEVDHDARIRVRRLSTSRQISRTSSSTRSRLRASRPTGRSGIRRTGRLSAAARRHDLRNGARGGLRILERRRQQRDRRRRPAMMQLAFCCVWNWDARPFPVFPIDSVGSGATQATGSRAIWVERAAASRCRRRRPTPPPAPGDLSDLPAARRRSAGRFTSGRSSQR